MRTPEAIAGMECPVCRVGLAMSDRQGIEIDYCPQCRGVWLDRGELDKIIERSVPEPARGPSMPQARPQSPWQEQDYRGHDPRYQKKRKKSFFEELFD
ncbi:zf-TFIIB domain-containing protein [Novosphingobium sp. M1R2S20]|uniref:Zf-TFIIB domain-containing protein n=1 Tax=Novosphingobium rhizovicinum TaxID=3228928 RepID=A0ABV3RDZ8_9SPHN